MIPKTAKDHEEPYATQFSAFLANRVGQLRDILGLFLEEGIRVLGLSVVDSTDWAVIRFVLDDPGKARAILKEHATPFTESEVLLVELDSDEVLVRITSLLLQAEINIHFAYALAHQPRQRPVLVLHVDDTQVAARVLVSHHFVLLGKEDLAEPESEEPGEPS